MRIKAKLALITVFALGLSGCQNGGADFRRVLRSAARETAKKSDADTNKKSSKKIQVAAITKCPEGAKLLGSPPPTGNAQWCSLPTKDGKGTKHGEYKKWFDDGKTKISSYFDNGSANGKYIEWFPSGQKKFQGDYLDNEKNGRWIEWNPEGVKLSETTYKGGNPHGKFVIWSRKGTIESEGTYLNGLKSGVWISYSATGSPKSKISYKAGKKHGPSEIYSRNGEIKNIESYHTDIPHGSWITFWPNGSKKLEGTYSKGQKEGTWTSYAKDGTLRDSVLYQNGTTIKLATNDTPRKTKKRKSKNRRFGKGDILGVDYVEKNTDQSQNQVQVEKPSKLSSGDNWKSF